MTGDQEKARIKQFIYAYVSSQPRWSVYSSSRQEEFPGAYHWLREAEKRHVCMPLPQLFERRSYHRSNELAYCQ